jgi:hypothetical protein
LKFCDAHQAYEAQHHTPPGALPIEYIKYQDGGRDLSQHDGPPNGFGGECRVVAETQRKLTAKMMKALPAKSGYFGEVLLAAASIWINISLSAYFFANGGTVLTRADVSKLWLILTHAGLNRLQDAL